MEQIVLTLEEQKLILKRRAREEKNAFSSITLNDCLRNYPTINKVIKTLHFPDFTQCPSTKRAGSVSPIKIDGVLYLQDSCYAKKGFPLFNVDVIRYELASDTFFGLPALRYFSSYCGSLAKEEKFRWTITCINNHVVNISCVLFDVRLCDFFDHKFYSVAHVCLKISSYKEFYYFALNRAFGHLKEGIECYCNIFLGKIPFFTDVKSFFGNDKKALEIFKLDPTVLKLVDFAIKNNLKKGGNNNVR